MKKWLLKYFPTATPSQTKGIAALLIILCLLKVAIYYLEKQYSQNVTWDFDEIKTLATQKYIDSIYKENENASNKITPFNPNYIKERKAGMLGMSLEEIDRLNQFREKGLFVNSAKEFQEVTKVSDELLNTISPYFKFPDWVVAKQQQNSSNKYSSTSKVKSYSTNNLNKATLDDLIQVRGIGEVLGQRIIDERDRFGGFVSIKQIEFIRNLSPEAIRELKKDFKVLSPKISKVNVNQASVDQLGSIPYLNNHLARQIVILRSKQSESLELSDFKKINNFPTEKIEIIALYLEF